MRLLNTINSNMHLSKQLRIVELICLKKIYNSRIVFAKKYLCNAYNGRKLFEIIV